MLIALSLANLFLIIAVCVYVIIDGSNRRVLAVAAWIVAILMTVTVLFLLTNGFTLP